MGQVILNAKTVVWDLDNTLLDSVGITEEILGKVLPKYGYSAPSREVLLKHYHGNLEEVIQGLLEDIKTEELAVILQDFLKLDNAVYEVVEHHLFGDALRLAERLARFGAKQIMVTNRAHGVDRLNASPRTMVKNSILKGYINHVICSDDTEHRKPKPDVLGALVAHESFDPATTVVIGDQFVDAEFARNLHARAILVCRDGARPAHMERLGSDWQSYVSIVRSLDDVTV